MDIWKRHQDSNLSTDVWRRLHSKCNTRTGSTTKQQSEAHHSSQGVWQAAAAAEWLGQKALEGLWGLSLSLLKTFPAAQPTPCWLFHKGIFSIPQPGCGFSANCFSSHPGGMKGPSSSCSHWSLLSAPEAAWEGPVKWAGSDTLNSSRSPQGEILTWHLTILLEVQSHLPSPCPLPESHFSCCHPAVATPCCLLSHQNPLSNYHS